MRDHPRDKSPPGSSSTRGMCLSRIGVCSFSPVGSETQQHAYAIRDDEVDEVEEPYLTPQTQDNLRKITIAEIPTTPRIKKW